VELGRTSIDINKPVRHREFLAVRIDDEQPAFEHFVNTTLFLALRRSVTSVRLNRLGRPNRLIGLSPATFRNRSSNDCAVLSATSAALRGRAARWLNTAVAVATSPLMTPVWRDPARRASEAEARAIPAPGERG
jgi:hypothetical protein